MEVAKKENRLKHYVICFVLAIVISLLPPVGQITQMGMVVLGVMTGVIYAWAVNLSPWVGLVAMLYYCFRVNESFTATTFPGIISNYTMWVTMFSLALVAAINKSGLVEYLATKIMGIRLAKKGPYALMAAAFLATFLTSVITQAVAAVFVLFVAMVKEWAKKMHLKQYSLWVWMTTFGIASAVLMASNAVPFNSSFQITMGILTSVNVPRPNIMCLCMVSFLGFVVTSIVIILITKYIIRPEIDLTAFRELDAGEMGKELKFTKTMGQVLGVVIIVALILAIPTVCPSDWGIYTIMSNIAVNGAFLLGVMLCSFIKDAEGKPLCDFSQILQSNTNWSIIFFLGAILYLGNLLNTETTGIITTLRDLFTVSNVAPLFIILISLFASLVVTNIINGMVTMLMFFPILVAAAGSNPVLMGIAIVGELLVVGYGFSLPGGSFNGLIMHSDKETFKFSHMFVLGFLMSLVVSIVLVLLVAAFGDVFYVGTL